MSTYDEAIRKANAAIGEAAPRVERNWLLEWVMDDCSNKACIDGNVSYDNGKNCRLYRCPLCGRSRILSAAIDKGPIEEWTSAEMEARLKDRKDVYFDKEFRYRRGKEIMVLLGDIVGAATVKAVVTCILVAVLLVGCGGEGEGLEPVPETTQGIQVTATVPHASETLDDIIEREKNNPLPPRQDIEIDHPSPRRDEP